MTTPTTRSKARYARATRVLAPVTLDEVTAAALTRLTAGGETAAALVRRLILAEDKSREPAAAPGDRRLAPWPDYAGNPVHEGDVIEHPDGMRGIVRFVPRLGADAYKLWRVSYPDCPNIDAPLAFQIDDKGQAVVRRP